MPIRNLVRKTYHSLSLDNAGSGLRHLGEMSGRSATMIRRQHGCIPGRHGKEPASSLGNLLVKRQNALLIVAQFDHRKHFIVAFVKYRSLEIEGRLRAW